MCVFCAEKRVLYLYLKTGDRNLQFAFGFQTTNTHCCIHASLFRLIQAKMDILLHFTKTEQWAFDCLGNQL